jgi:hypothetical protein
MAALLAGRGSLRTFYDRDGIVYRNEGQDRNFKLASRVEFDTPVPGASPPRPGSVVCLHDSPA